MIDIELYQATGSSKDIEVVDNLNWKSISGGDTSYPYYMYPVRKPYLEDSDMYECSYVKYTYGVISGTYTKAKRVRWVITYPTCWVTLPTPLIYLDTRLYYKMISSYTTPSNLLMTGTTINYSNNLNLCTSTSINSSTSLFPCVSTTSPETATSRVMNLSPNTTYYTNYLVTQLYVKRGEWDNVGNTTPITISLTVDDYE